MSDYLPDREPDKFWLIATRKMSGSHYQQFETMKQADKILRQQGGALYKWSPGGWIASGWQKGEASR